MNTPNMHMHGGFDMRERSLSSTLSLCYILYGLSYVFGGLPAIIAIIVDYVKKDDAIGYPIFEEHFQWQINTFWGLIALGIIGLITFLAGIGILILIFGFFWGLYRAIKGWIYLSDGRSLYGNPQAAPQAPQAPYAQPQSDFQPGATRRFCTKCGGQLEADAAFCSNCGAKL